MNVRRFRHFAAIRCHWIFAMGMAFFWGWLMLLPTLSEGGWQDAAEVEAGAERYVERELLFLEAGQDRGLFWEWWTEQADREEKLAELTEVLSSLPERERVAELRLMVASEGGSFFSEAEEVAQLWRSLVVGLPYLGALVGSIFALWFLRGRWGVRGRVSRITGAWSWTTVLVVFFLAEIAGQIFIYGTVSVFVYALLGAQVGDVVTAFVWRGAAPLLAAFALVGTWSGIWRVYRLGEPVRWGPVAGVFCLLALWEMVRTWIGAESGVVDPSDFLLIANPAPWELLYDVVDTVIFAPVFEELMFRGVLFLGLMKGLGPMRAALLSSLLFAVIHTQYDAWEIASVGVFGLACCWLTWRTGSLKSSIALHVIYNGLITIDVYLLYQLALP